jgi:two-component sensor histidine kinase
MRKAKSSERLKSQGDITEQKRTGDQIATLAREAEHRSKNLLANVQAMVNLSQADAVADLKKVIEGRIQALANVHSLFVATRWIAELSTIAEHELAPYSTREKRVRIDGPQVLLAPHKPSPSLCTSWRLTPSNTELCPRPLATST